MTPLKKGSVHAENICSEASAGSGCCLLSVPFGGGQAQGRRGPHGQLGVKPDAGAAPSIPAPVSWSIPGLCALVAQHLADAGVTQGAGLGRKVEQEVGALGVFQKGATPRGAAGRPQWESAACR